MLDVFDRYRQLNGVIDLDKIPELKEIEDGTYGSRKKQWFDFQSDLLLFKEEKLPLESIKEIICEQMALQYGVDNVSYDVARYKGKYGVISPDFKKGKEFIPFLFLLLKRPKISNDLTTLCDILESMDIDREEILSFARIIFRNHLLDIFTMQRDRNVTNQGFLYDGSNYFLAPRYDCGGSFLTITARAKQERFCNQYNSDMLLKYKGYRSKFTLYPGTVKLDAIDVLLDIRYSGIMYNNFYLGEVLKDLDSEIDKIYNINMREIFTRLESYNIKMEPYFKRFLECAFETKKREYEGKEKVYRLS